MTTVFYASFAIVDGDAVVGFMHILKSQIMETHQFGGRLLKCISTPWNVHKVLKRPLKMLKLQPNLGVLA